MEEKKRALVIGGTGGVGAFLVEKLLDSPSFSGVTVIARKALREHKKLDVILWDDFSDHLLTSNKKTLDVFKGHDVLFCCLGASEKALIGLVFNKKKYEPMFQLVDHDLVVAAAHIAFKSGISSFSVISSPSAKPNARFAYSRIKWEMEKELKLIGFPKLSIFHPHHLMKPARKSESIVKRIFKNVMAFIARLLPAEQKAIKVEEVAKAMLIEYITNLDENGVRIAYYSSDDMRLLITRENSNENIEIE